jgi:hypothetical protein
MGLARSSWVQRFWVRRFRVQGSGVLGSEIDGFVWVSNFPFQKALFLKLNNRHDSTKFQTIRDWTLDGKVSGITL